MICSTLFNIIYRRKEKNHTHSGITGRLLYCLEKVSCSNEDNLSLILTKSSGCATHPLPPTSVARDKNNFMNQKPLELFSANEGNSISVMLQNNRQK